MSVKSTETPSKWSRYKTSKKTVSTAKDSPFRKTLKKVENRRPQKQDRRETGKVLDRHKLFCGRIEKPHQKPFPIVQLLLNKNKSGQWQKVFDDAKTKPKQKDSQVCQHWAGRLKLTDSPLEEPAEVQTVKITQTTPQTFTLVVAPIRTHSLRCQCRKQRQGRQRLKKDSSKLQHSRKSVLVQPANQRQVHSLLEK